MRAMPHTCGLQYLVALGASSQEQRENRNPQPCRCLEFLGGDNFFQQGYKTLYQTGQQSGPYVLVRLLLRSTCTHVNFAKNTSGHRWLSRIVPLAQRLTSYRNLIPVDLDDTVFIEVVLLQVTKLGSTWTITKDVFFVTLA